jgi:hypothetical protein
MTMRTGMPIPTTAKMIWKASDIAIWERAARRSDMGKKVGIPESFQKSRQ